MVTKSMKRIIWSLGWMFIWALQDFYLLMAYPSGYEGEMSVGFVSLLILVIPLFVFKDDKPQIVYIKKREKNGK